MLTNLHIENYAIIEHLDLELYAGLNTITGQTGAGKSILLGALGLLGGAKAEPTVIGTGGDQLVVQGEFDIASYGLERFFEQNDLDYAPCITIRRVVSRTGKNRAFVDTTPVTLALLKDLAAKLVDIHSQHETLLVAREDFQREILDAVAANGSLLDAYGRAYAAYREAEKELARVIAAASAGRERGEYLAYQIEKLDELKLRKGECEELEEEQSMLSSAEDIAADLSLASAAMQDEDSGMLMRIKAVASALGRVGRKLKGVEQLGERVISMQIELRDVARDVEALGEGVVANPQRLEAVNRRLDTIYSMCKKHSLDRADELIDILQGFKEEYMAIEGGDVRQAECRAMVEQTRAQAEQAADKLAQSRVKVSPKIEKSVAEELVKLGIKGAQFKVDIARTELSATGADSVRFLFAGGAAQQLLPLEKVASGGEMSRLMLSLKGLVARSLRLPTVVFDEIDTGVSGAVADAMGGIIEAMGSSMQVINITHLAQVASKGEHHFLVYKDKGTHIKKLEGAERLEQIASMLSGAEVTDAARAQAATLLAIKNPPRGD